MAFPDYNTLIHRTPATFNTGALQGLLRDKHEPRPPEDGEVAFFAANPHIPGYAADDDRVVLSPSIPEAWKPSVWANEAARIEMRRKDDDFAFDLTPQQRAFFAGSAYDDNPQPARQTIIARIIAGDQSAAPYTRDQHFAASQWAGRYGVR